jgi:hypothetical protein
MIRATAPIFRPYKKGTFITRAPSLPGFLANEETEHEEFDSTDSEAEEPDSFYYLGSPIYIDEVFKRAQEYVRFLFGFGFYVLTSYVL